MHLCTSSLFLHAGDSAYPLEPWMLTPVTNARACRRSRAIRRYNSRHASMRSVVERCIGLLKQRFGCLHKYRTLFYSPDIAGTIISACAILHNVCLYVGEAEPQPEPEDDSNQTPRPEPIANPPAPAQFGQLYERAQAARASQVARCERP